MMIDTHDLKKRDLYLKKIIAFRDTEPVKVVTGIRRCGKSSLLDLFHQYLTESGVAEDHIIHMNLESLRYRSLSDHLSFYDHVSRQIPAVGKTYLIFDELQVVSHWEKAVESFRLDYDVDIDAPEDPKPVRISREGYDLRTMYKEDAIMELEISGKPFVLYRNARRNVLQIVYRLRPGEYSIIELGNELKA